MRLSVTGTWLVGAIPDREANELLARFSDALSGPGPMQPRAFAEALEWWTTAGEQEGFFERVPGKDWERATDAAYRLASLVDGANPETELSEAAWDACMDLMGDEGEDALLGVAARKASPVAALCYALGAESMSMLPGRFGNFLLSHAEVLAGLPRAERALQPAGARRAQTLQRIGTWMKEMGDEPNFDAEKLLDGPLRVLRHAAATGYGAAAFTRWY
ncbi:hypothetical protein [Actinomadura sp. 3N407]|uniref:hypothetical protein n=1 Tax=Actinomadura sp. 3N407 TaxID=3457423 RepID=UPI003FCCA980